jgi:hypothetical protein
MARTTSNLPAVNGLWCVVEIPAFTGGVHGQSLMAQIRDNANNRDLETIHPNNSDAPIGILIGNDSGATIWIKSSTGAQASRGIPIAADGTLYLPLSGTPSDELWYEAAGAFSVAVFF